MRTWPKGEAHPRWKGGRYVDHQGYWNVLMPGHPHAMPNGYVLEHILIVLRALGRDRMPKGAHVHHVDENKSNNDPPNLVLCDNAAYHKLLHKRQRALDACGDPNALPCCKCGRFDDQAGMRRYAGPRGRTIAYHRECANRCMREYAKRRRDEGRPIIRAKCQTA